MVLLVQPAAKVLASLVYLGDTGNIGGTAGRSERHPAANDSNKNVDPPDPMFSVRQNVPRLRLHGTVGAFQAHLLWEQ